MLSYRHAYHAGNHADVLKHLVLVLTLDHMSEKADKPFVYIDTHAGAGGYDLSDARALKNTEYEQGIGRLWDANSLPLPLARYVGVIHGFNPDGALAHYPGSPAIARSLSSGRLELCELHGDDFRRLSKWAGRERRVRVHHQDGFARLKALLPPIERRALVLLDPPYEVKDDYARVAQSLNEALARFATGVYLAWYPLLAQAGPRQLCSALEGLSDRWLRVELEVEEAGSPGLFGSGVFVFNPPWRLADRLTACRHDLEARLCGPGAAGLSVNRGKQ